MSLSTRAIREVLRTYVRRGDLDRVGEAVENPAEFARWSNLVKDPERLSEEDKEKIARTAKRAIEEWGLEGKLVKRDYFGDWDTAFSFYYKRNKIFEPEIYIGPSAKAYMLGYVELTPELIRSRFSIKRGSEQSKELSRLYKEVSRGKRSSDEYIEYLRGLGVDLEPIKLFRGGSAVGYPMLFEIGPKVTVNLTPVKEGREALEFVEKHRVVSPSVLERVAEVANRIFYDDIDFEDIEEELWDRSPLDYEAAQILREIDDEEGLNLYWDEVEQVYRTGYWSDVYRREGEPETVEIWYIRTDGTIGHLENKGSLVPSSAGLEAVWTARDLVRAYEKITQAIGDSHPLSGVALREEVVEGWIKDGLAKHIEDKIVNKIKELDLETLEDAEKTYEAVFRAVEEEIPPHIIDDLFSREEIKRDIDCKADLEISRRSRQRAADKGHNYELEV